MDNFFDKTYQTPRWLQAKLSRRQIMKSAAGSSVLTILHHTPVSAQTLQAFDKTLQTEQWQTLDAVLMHMLPNSAIGPSAKEIQATLYLFNLVHEQPTEMEEIAFIYKGVGWLNGFTEKNLGKRFIALTTTEKESTLRAISRSRAGENWLNMLINNIFEAMLAPPSYGGNPNGKGWQWLSHKPGFPLPPEGKRYYELPKRSQVKRENIAINFVSQRDSQQSSKRTSTKITNKKVTKA